MIVAEILKQIGECEDHALRKHAALLTLSKMSRYESECALFEKKYKDTLSSAASPQCATRKISRPKTT